MKNKTIAKVMATAMAMALAFTVMPSMNVHAAEDHVNDGLAHSDKDGGNGGTSNAEMDKIFDDYFGGSSSSDSGSSSSSNDSYSEPSYDYSSSNDGGSSDSYSGGGNDSYNEPSYDGGASSGGNSTASAPAAGTSGIGKTVSVPGCQVWRQKSVATAGQFTVMHCGIVQYQFQLIDKDSNAVSYKSAELKQGEAGLWYINITTDETVDTTGYGVSTLKGSITYMPELGVTGVMLNGTVIASGT